MFPKNRIGRVPESLDNGWHETETPIYLWIMLRIWNASNGMNSKSGRLELRSEVVIFTSQSTCMEVWSDVFLAHSSECHSSIRFKGLWNRRVKYIHTDAAETTSCREVLRIAGLDDLQVKLDTRTLKFAGHVARMGPGRNPNRLIFNNAPTGSRSYTHTVAAAATRAGIAGNWPVTAQIRSYWSDKIAKYISRSKLSAHKRKR